MPHRQTTSLALLIAVLVILLPGAAQASQSTVRVGVSDANAVTLSDPNFTERLGVERTRYVIRWNAIDDAPSLARADQFMAAARANDIDVLLHFSTDDFTPRAARLPSRAEYRSKVGALVDRYYPLGVREYGVWNEANDRTQPTYRSPARAADFFIDLWQMLNDRDKCGITVTGKCRVIALDLLDGRTAKQRGDVRSYTRRFYDRLSSTYDRRGRFVGIHNYSDTNRRGTSGTKNIIDTVSDEVRDPVFWMTETGGIVKLGDTGSFTCRPSSASSVRSAEARADRAVDWMLRLAKRYRRDVDRLYVYQYSGNDCADRFDAGLVRADRSKRPAFYELERGIKRSKILKP